MNIKENLLSELPTAILHVTNDPPSSSHILEVVLMNELISIRYFKVWRRKYIKYSRFSLFAVLLFYKVTANTEPANIEALLLWEIQG